MKNTIIMYIVIGILFIVPLLLFNIRKIWVRRPAEPIKFKPLRFIFVLLFSAFIILFLVTACNKTLDNRYEIASERIAQKHAQVITGDIKMSEFRDFVMKHGTQNVQESFDNTEFPVYDKQSVRFQLSDWCIPKYWLDEEGFEQVPKIDDNNPVYIMYLLQMGDQKDYYVVRMVNTDNGWKYDWFGNANEQHIDIIEMPSEINGKWYTVNPKK